MEYTNIKFEIKIGGEWIDKSQFLQLPISITETLDETLDRAEVILNFTSDNEEYEAYSDAIIIIESNGAVKKYDMVVQKDTMEEWHDGALTSYYKHSLLLIEATYKLSTIQVQDFSITQPAKVNLLGVPWSPTLKNNFVENSNTPLVATKVGNITIFTVPSALAWRETGVATTNIDNVSSSTTRKNGIYNFKIDYDFGNFYKEYDKFSTPVITFPALPNGSFGMFSVIDFNGTETVQVANDNIGEITFEEILQRINPGTGLPIESIPIPPLTRRITTANLAVGKYRYIISSRNKSISHNSQVYSNRWWADIFPFRLDQVLYGNKTVLQVLESNAGGLLPTSKLFSLQYDFDIVNERIEPSAITIDQALEKTLDNIVPEKLFYDKPYYRVATTNDAVNNTASYELSTEDYNVYSTAYTLENMINLFGEPTDYNIGSIFTLSYVNNSEPWLEEARQFVVSNQTRDGTLNPIIYEPGVIDSSVYYGYKGDRLYFDRQFLITVDNIKSLEYVFAGGKNLMEILVEIGKQFDGIPRVKFNEYKKPYIYFDILKNLSDNSLFSDDEGEYLSTIESNTDNHATKLVSTLENVITDDQGTAALDTIFYPSSKSWARLRPENYGDAMLKLENVSLSMDDNNIGIYKIKSLKVRNYRKSNASVIPSEPIDGLDISEYILEKNIYDTLETSINQKGTSLYYERGKNQILNIGTIFDKDVVFGMNGETRVIQNIIIDKLGLQQTINQFGLISGNFKPVLDYEFRVEYVPVISKIRLKIEQSKRVVEDISSEISYSQNERNINLSQFGKSSDRILKRSGINSIIKRYLITDMNFIPVIGERFVKNSIPYYADSITTSFENDFIASEVSYSKDYNKIDKLVGFKKDFREYEIFRDEIVWKRINVENYCYIDDISYTDNVFDSLIKRGFMTSIGNLFLGESQDFSTDRLTGALVRFTDKDGKPIMYESENGEMKKVSDVNLPLIGTYSNNSLIFSLSMYDNASVGRKTTDILFDINKIKTDSEYEALPGQDKWLYYAQTFANSLGLIDSDNNGFEDNRKLISNIRYVDDFGRVDIMRVMMIKELFTQPPMFNPNTYPEFKPVGTNMDEYRDYASFDETFYITKDNKEAIQFIFQMQFQSKNPNIDIRPALLKYNPLINNDRNQITAESLQIIGLTDMEEVKEKDILVKQDPLFPNADYDYTQSEVITDLASIFASFEAGHIAWVPVISPSNVSKNYQGYAVIIPSTGEIVLTKRESIQAGANQVQPIVFNFTEKVK